MGKCTNVALALSLHHYGYTRLLVSLKMLAVAAYLHYLNSKKKKLILESGCVTVTHVYCCINKVVRLLNLSMYMGP